MRGRWKTALILIPVLVAGGYVASQRWNQPEPELATSPVVRGSIENVVLASGTIRPSNLVAVGAQVTGRVISLEVQAGQTIKAGDVVAVIDATTQTNELEKARAILRQNEATHEQNTAELELAELDLQRVETMIRNNSIARAEYDRAVTNRAARRAQTASSEAAITVATIDVEIAETNIAYTQITAPADGTVLRTLVQEGQTVNAQQSAPTIAIIGQLDVMTVEADISEADIGLVHEGLPLNFTIFGRDPERYDAQLEIIEPAPESIVGDRIFATAAGGGSSDASSSPAIYYKGLFNVPNPDGLLRTYMTAEINIVLDSAADVLLVPNSTLRAGTGPGVATVHVLRGGRIEERSVETGITDGVQTEIVSGLEEGETIVTAPSASNQSPGS